MLKITLRDEVAVIKRLFRLAVATSDCIACLKAVAELEWCLAHVYARGDTVEFSFPSAKGRVTLVGGYINSMTSPAWYAYVDGECLYLVDDRIVSSDCVSTAEAVMAVKTLLTAREG